MTYLATFFSHFGAMRYYQECTAQGLEAEMMPVPRELSSSCGTCVRYVDDEPLWLEASREELEAMVREEAGAFHELESPWTY